MEEQLISLETAKIAKEKKIEIKSIKGYYVHGTEKDFKVLLLWCDSETNKPEFGYAPTQSLLQKRLREEHQIHITIGLVDTPRDFYWYSTLYLFAVKQRNYIDEIMWDEPSEKEIESKSKTYEEALEVALQESLKLIEL